MVSFSSVVSQFLVDIGFMVDRSYSQGLWNFPMLSVYQLGSCFEVGVFECKLRRTRVTRVFTCYLAIHNKNLFNVLINRIELDYH